jgi:hypothetical protein
MFIHIDGGGNGMLSMLWSVLYSRRLLFTFPFNRFTATRHVKRIMNPEASIPREY